MIRIPVTCIALAAIALTCLWAPARAFAGSPLAPVFVHPKAGDEHQAPEGHVSLRWKYPRKAAGPRKLKFELQQASSPSFTNARTRYLGPDRACFLSGLDEGTFYYRVRARGSSGARGPWSATRSVHVRYTSMRLVVVLMVLGFVLLSATVLVIVRGHRRTRNLVDSRASSTPRPLSTSPDAPGRSRQDRLS